MKEEDDISSYAGSREQIIGQLPVSKLQAVITPSVSQVGGRGPLDFYAPHPVLYIGHIAVLKIILFSVEETS